MKRHETIPKDFAVRPLTADQTAEDRVTCGHCGLSWDDAVVTAYTPAPSARCPFEAFHVHAANETDREMVIRELAFWVVNGEMDDFIENPDENHPYFKALMILDGEDAAREALADAINDLDGDQDETA